MARAFLEPNTDFEPEFIKEQLARRERNEQKNENEPKENYGFYDTTAWSLPFAYGLEAYWTEDAPSTPMRILEMGAKGVIRLNGAEGGLIGGKARVAYLIRYDQDASILLAMRLLQENFKLAVATKPIKAEGREWGRGTFIVRISRNPDSLHARIEALAKELGVNVYAASTGFGDQNSGGLGSEYIVNVKKPSIAVAGGEGVSQTSFGAVWHLLEKQAKVKFTSLSLRAIRSADLSRFNVIILPSGFGYSTLGKSGADLLKEWVSKGGALIGLGGGGVWFADQEAALTSAVKVGAEDKEKEDKEKPDEKTGGTADKPSEKHKPKKPIELAGSIFRARLNTTHFLGYGYSPGDSTEIAVPLSGDTFLKPSLKGSNVVTFGKDNLRLSGFTWPDNTEKLLANTAYVIDEPTGAGHAILFLDDPTFRGYWIGLRRLFLNGILFGPERVPSIPAGSEE
jgi:hypothetical protein